MFNFIAVGFMLYNSDRDQRKSIGSKAPLKMLVKLTLGAARFHPKFSIPPYYLTGRENVHQYADINIWSK
jgi:hypothetical protein